MSLFLISMRSWLKLYSFPVSLVDATVRVSVKTGVFLKRSIAGQSTPRGRDAFSCCRLSVCAEASCSMNSCTDFEAMFLRTSNILLLFSLLRAEGLKIRGFTCSRGVPCIALTCMPVCLTYRCIILHIAPAQDPLFSRLGI